MNIQEYLALDENEKPLDNIVSDGGYCGIFRKICCIGDSLSSGEFEVKTADGKKSFHDMFDYSWGQYLARDCGCTVYNFSRGGMTAQEYMESFADQNDFWSTEKLCQAYIIALGVNDLYGKKQPCGSLDSIDLNDMSRNKKDFAGYYAQIIQRLRAMQPKAHFFLVTMPKSSYEPEPAKKEHAKLLHDIARVFPHTHVIDLYEYCPPHNGDFIKRFYLHGHLNPSGYRLTAKIIESYMDYIIRHDPKEFIQTSFIGTPMYDDALEK